VDTELWERIYIQQCETKIHVPKFVAYLFLCSFLLLSFFCYIKEGVGGEREGKGTGEERRSAKDP
jgi:hypothetical protein